MSEYTNFKRPIDVLLAAGLNNFRTDSPDVIIGKMRAFKETVMRRQDGSTFAICTLPFAPSLVDLDLKVNSQYWNLGEKTMKMFRLNEMIKAENRIPTRFAKVINPKICQNAPRFHTWGLMSDPKATREHERSGNWFDRISGYRLGDWREWDIQRKLHFKDSVRLRAGKCVHKYFLSLYNLIDQPPIEASSSTDGIVTSKESSSDSSSESSDSGSLSSSSSSVESGSSSSDSSDSSVICLTPARWSSDDEYPYSTQDNLQQQ